MTTDLVVRISSAKNYYIDAKGKNALKIENYLTQSDINSASRRIIDGDLVIETTGGKKIRLTNWDSITTIKTTDNQEGFLLTLTEERAPITNPISGNKYVGTALNDIIDTRLAPEVKVTKKVKQGKKYVNKLVGTGVGVTIEGGYRDDTIYGSNYNDKINAGDGHDTIYIGKGNDTITGGEGINTYIIDTENKFGTTTINLTQGETIQFQLKAASGITDWENIVPYFSGKDLIANIYREKVPMLENYARPITNQTCVGTIILKNFLTTDVALRGYDNRGISNSYELKFNGLNIQETLAYFYQLDLDWTQFQGGKTYYGTMGNDTINASNATRHYVTKKVKGKKTKVYDNKGVTIVAGDGADTIYGSKYDDTIYGGAGDDVIEANAGNDTIIGGEGQNTLIFTQNFGNDTIKLTSGEELIINLAAYGDLTFENLEKTIVGNDLKLTVREGSTVRGTITLQGFSKEDVTSSVKIQFAAGVPVTLTDANVIPNASNSYSTVGSRFSDNVIDASNGGVAAHYEKVKGKKKLIPAVGVTIKGSDKNEEITGSKYNDTITGGEGTNTVHLKATEAFGSDTYNMSYGENLVLKIDGDIAPGDINKTPVGNDLVVTVRNKGSITIKNFALNATGSAMLRQEGQADFDLKSLVEGKYVTYNGSRTLTGTFEGDTINASNTPQNYTTKKVKKKIQKIYDNKGVTINAGDGDNIITGSKYNDTIRGGKNDNILYLSIDEKFGDDVYYLTEGENLRIKLEGTNDGAYTTSVVGDDLTITVYDNNVSKKVMGKLIIKGFGKEDISNSIRIYSRNEDVFDGGAGYDIKWGVAESDMPTITKGGTYQGTRLIDNIDASNATEIMAGRTVKKGKKKVTVYDVHTGRGVTIDAKEGDDHIEGSKFADVITGGEGDDTIHAGKGDDIIYGGEGDDFITGGEGNDKIYSGASTGGGFNTIYFAAGDGNDTFFSEGGKDVLRFTTVQNYKDLILTSNGKDLAIKYTGDDSVTLDSYFTDIEKYNNCLIQIEGEGPKSLGVFINEYNDGVHNNIFYKPLYEKRELAISGSGTISGTEIDDEILGSDKADTITSGSGDDIIHSSKGNDVITAGAGENVIIYETKNFGTDRIKLSPDEDLIIDLSPLNLEEGVSYSYSGNDLIINTTEGKIILDSFVSNAMGRGPVSLRLTPGGSLFDLDSSILDRFIVERNFTGTQLSEVIDASGVKELMGARTVKVKGKKKTVYDVHTGRGATITTGEGTNTVIGSNFNDTITLDNGWNDEIRAGKGNDTIQGGIGTGVIYGEEGADTIRTGEGNYTVYGGEGNDTIYGEAIHTGASQRIRGGEGNDTIYASNNGATSDIYGDEGNDTIYGSTNKANDIYGGEGNDKIYIQSPESNLVYAGSGNDEIYLSNGARAQIYLNEGNNTVHLAQRHNWTGSDIQLGAGNDTIYMSTTTTGGGNADDYDITSEGKPNGGHDVFYWGGASYTNGQHDMITFGGQKYDELIFTKNNGSNDLIVRYGENNDVTFKDYFKVGNEDFGRSMTLRANDTEDWIDFPDVIAAKGVQTLITGVVGGDGNDYIIGTDERDIIRGGAGYDVINPKGGNDEIYLGEGNDVLFAGDGSKYIDAVSGNNIIHLGNGGNTLVLGTGEDTVYSGAIENSICFIEGDEGDDIYYVAQKEWGRSDTFNFASDTIYTLTLDARDSENIIIRRDSGKTITLKGYEDETRQSGFWVVAGGNQVRLVDLGTIIGDSETDESQTIATGGGSDTVYLGKGSDTLTVGLRNDTIYLSALAESGNNDTYTYQGETGVDTFIMPDEVLNTDKFSFIKSGSDLIFAYNNDMANNTLTIKNYYTNAATIGTNVKFKVGENEAQSLKSLTELKGVTEPIEGTESADILGNSESGTNQMISGLGGADTIKGGLGNDFLNGGAGADTITGGAGNDTYVIDEEDWGDGQDVITDASGDNDMLRIDTTPNNIHLYFDVTQTGVTDGVVTYTTGADLYINSTDEFDLSNAKVQNGVKIVNYFTESGKIEGIKLADGTTDAFDSRLISTTGQAVANWLYKNGKTSVAQVLASGTDEEKAALLNIYKPIITDATINATDYSDIIYGTRINTGERQRINAGDGDDYIFASDNGAYSDIYAEGGDDVIYGSSAYVHNYIYAGAGNDTVYVRNADTNIVYANQGNDTIYVADGARAQIYLSEGNNTVHLGERSNWFGNDIQLGSGNDIIYMSTTSTNSNGNADDFEITSEQKPNGGHDVFYWGGAEYTGRQHDMITFGGQKYEDIYLTRADGSDDLVIRYNGDNDVTFKDYFKEGNEDFGRSMCFAANDKDWTGFTEDYDLHNNDIFTDRGLKHYITGSGTINGTMFEDDYIIGSSGNDTVKNGNVIGSIYADGGNDFIDGKAGDDTIYIAGGNQVIYGGLGSDNINDTQLYSPSFADSTTIRAYTNSQYGGKDTNIGTHDFVSFSKLTTDGNIVYAQSYWSDITGGQGNDNYFSYIDQKTTITDASGADMLTITNTDSTTDGAKSNLHVLFNVTSDYDYNAENPETLFSGNVLLTSDATKANYDKWISNSYYTGVKIAENKIETIKSSDGYTLTNEDISALAESVAGWLTTNGYGSVSDVFSNALGKTSEASTADIANLIARFDSNTNWTQPV